MWQSAPHVNSIIDGRTWDNTDYSLTAGVFSEGFGDPGFVPSDLKDAVTQILAFVRMRRIVIVQNYFASPSDLARRRYVLDAQARRASRRWRDPRRRFGAGSDRHVRCLTHRVVRQISGDSLALGAPCAPPARMVFSAGPA